MLRKCSLFNEAVAPTELLRKHHHKRRGGKINTTLCRLDPREHEGEGKEIKRIKIKAVWKIPQDILNMERRKGWRPGKMCQRKWR